MRLQQILLFKEFELPLAEIQSILDRPGFDPLQTLRAHRQVLADRMEHSARLLQTVDRTIQQLTEDNMTLTDEEIFDGMTPEQVERYGKEARQRWGEETVSASEQKVRKLSKQQWAAVRAESEQVTQLMAGYVGRAPDDPEVQQAILRHHAWIENFYPVPAEVYRGLANLYVEHPEFRAHYEQYRPGLAEFMKASMEVYCDRILTGPHKD